MGLDADFFLTAAAFSLTALMCFLAGCAFMGKVLRKACEAAVERARRDERAKAAAWGRGMIDQGNRVIGQMDRQTARHA